MMITEGIKLLVENRDLPAAIAEAAMREILTGNATSAQIASFATALRMKGELPDELAAMARVMREFSTHIHPMCSGRLVDTCGTGGGTVRTFNVSTIAAFIAAGAGVNIAKHGNRSFSGSSGSADLLAALGFDLQVEATTVEKTIEEDGIGFMFAPSFHPAMRNASAPRREITIRTVFNYLGPLTNPADADAQLLGVSEKEGVLLMAQALKQLGCRNALVVHGEDGLDELSTIGPTFLAFLDGSEIRTGRCTPADLGLSACKPQELSCGEPIANAEVALKILGGSERGTKSEFALANAAGAVLVGKGLGLREAVEVARESLESGRAQGKLRSLIQKCGDIGRLEELEREYG